MHSILSNQSLINEINGIKDNYIQSRPHMIMNAFKGTRRGDGRTNKYDRAEQPRFMQGGGSPAFKSHPLGYQPPGGGTVGPDPLFSGVVDRPTPRGGAMLKRHMPLNCEESESDEEGGGYGNCDSSDYDSDDCGAGIVDDVKDAYNKVANKTKDRYNKTKEYIKSKMPSKAELEKISKDIYTMVTSDEGRTLGVNALKVAVAAYVVTKLGPYGAPVVAAANKTIDEVISQVRKGNQRGPQSVASAAGLSMSPRGGKIKRLAMEKLPKGKSVPMQKKPVPIVGKKRGEKVRGSIVSEIMRKKGLSLGAASKYVKEHNLY